MEKRPIFNDEFDWRSEAEDGDMDLRGSEEDNKYGKREVE